MHTIKIFFIGFSFKDIRLLDWERINQTFQTRCPNVLAVVDMLLSFPAGSVDAERGFSHMKRVMSDWRSRLTDTCLADQLTIVMESPDVNDFDPSDAVHLWCFSGQRSRRPTFKDSTSDEEDDESD